MQRIAAIKISSLALALLLLFGAISVSAESAKKLKQRREAVVEGFITALIESAIEPGTAPEQTDKLLKAALGYAETYSLIKDKGAFYREVRHRVLTLTSASGSPVTSPLTSENNGVIKKFQEKALHGNRYSRNVNKVRVRALVEALIGKALMAETPLGAQPTERQELLGAASDLADTYAELARDENFAKRIQYLIKSLPPKHISSDEDIIKEFNKALDHDNRLVMEFLTARVTPRIELFLTEMIERAGKRGVPETEKEMLLKTAMNFAKTLGNMTGDHSFHRVIHRRTFTARLTKPTQSRAALGFHIIDAPKAAPKVKNVFVPDNIIINAGGTVRWVNHDDITHVIGSLDFLSDGRFFTPNIKPRGRFEHTFFVPGEYYYICYIHNSMIGKITVIRR